MFRKPYFLARTTGNMELVRKKNSGSQHPTIHASVAYVISYLFHISLHSLYFSMIFQEK